MSTSPTTSPPDDHYRRLGQDPSFPVRPVIPSPSWITQPRTDTSRITQAHTSVRVTKAYHPECRCAVSISLYRLSISLYRFPRGYPQIPSGCPISENTHTKNISFDGNPIYFEILYFSQLCKKHYFIKNGTFVEIQKNTKIPFFHFLRK